LRACHRAWTWISLLAGAACAPSEPPPASTAVATELPAAEIPADDPPAELEELRPEVAELEALRTAVSELEAANAALRGQLEAAEHAAANGGDDPAGPLRRQIAELEAELERETTKRIAREEEWLRYTRAVAALELRSMPEELRFQPDLPPEALLEAARAPEPEPSAEEQALAERSAEIERALRALLAIEEVRGLDLLEAGRLGEGWIGPVVFRLLDDRGRLAGGLYAERLRLEGSRAARTLTLVLEDGYETRAGERSPFVPSSAAEPESAPEPANGTAPATETGSSRGVRRIALPRVDPEPWLEEMGELFATTRLDQPVDDGLWNLTYVRGTLNQLLREDPSAGWWRLRALDGVLAGVLRGVHLEGFTPDGRLERHLFADRMQVLRADKGLLLLLEDGAQMRGDEKAAFIDGRFRIFLPRADAGAWEAAGVPGLAEPTARAVPGER
jgi:hypothetical protein